MLSAGTNGGNAQGLLETITPGFQGFGPPYAQYGFEGSFSTFKSMQSSDAAKIDFSASLTLPSNWGDVTVYALDRFSDDIGIPIHENLKICQEQISQYSCVISHTAGTPLTITEDDGFSSVLPGEYAQWQFTVLFTGAAVPEPKSSALLAIALALSAPKLLRRRSTSIVQ